MQNSITDVNGIKVGNAQDLEAGTGCTVVICEKGAVTGAAVLGGAPGTRETDSLNPINLITKTHAVYLGGGSAYGLDGASGVMKYLEEKKLGFDSGFGIVPIVPGAVLFDLPVGSSYIRPDKEMGYKACLNATENFYEQGNIGAGTGASVGKINGMDLCMKGGLGTASIKTDNLTVAAIVAVNCLGDVIDPLTGKILAGALNKTKSGFAYSTTCLSEIQKNSFPGNTTIGCVATNAVLNKPEATKIAMMAHDGLARSINPIHTMFDGDAVFCMATCQVKADPTHIGALAAEVMAKAVINGVKNADSAYSIPGFKEINRLFAL